MKLRWILLTLAATATVTLVAQNFAEVPIIDFRLPWFDEKTGRKAAELVGKEARWFQDDNRVEITLLKLKVFDPKNPAEVEAEISSPLAIVLPDDRTVNGPGQLRVEGRSYELYGDDWTYYHETRTVVIRKDVVATLRFEMGNILE
jgi:hypothetical protein